MLFAFWGLMIFCGLSFLVNCYLFHRNQKIFQQNKNILSNLQRISADMGHLVTSSTMMGQKILSLESNMVAVFNQLERRLKTHSVSSASHLSSSAKAQTKAEASVLQLLSE
ncbi:hypothetical protein [Candidatus Berkiella aquae]|uniref:Uncharacterized protein n=1 Tax=Candidatus Berkiella aquae TaxID=295108 RepID=A0A0Q9YUR8_9GAMM|nr:hypothetical protein [Candidatus Berkiella aquae]MCS5711405.1 hypothetical protein [Candidatus Berkiella aquae]